MAKGIIPRDFIDNLLERLEIAEVISRKIKLKKNGAHNYLGLCPFHNEKTPSFTVNTAKNFYHCFGCKASGNALKFIMEYDRLDFVSAVEYLATHAGVQVPYQQNNDPDFDKKIALNKTLYEVLFEAQNIYIKQLKSHPQRNLAIDYLKNRGFSGEIAKRFGLGFAPNQHNFIISQLQNKYEQETLKLAGLIGVSEKNNSIYDRFRARIMFPIRDKRGRVTGFGGRIINNDMPKYLNSPETPVFHKSQQLYGLYEMHQMRRTVNEIIVVEGYLDVISLAQYGIFNTVATLGTAISDTQINLLLRECNKVIFCFDGDTAGRKAADNAAKIALTCVQDGQQIQVVFLPEGHDPDSFIQQNGVDKLQEYIAGKAIMLSDYIFEHLITNIDIHTIEGKAHLQQTAGSLIKQIKGNNLRIIMEQRLRDITGIGNNSVQNKSAAYDLPVKSANNLADNLIKNYAKNCKQILRILLVKPDLAAQITLDNIEIYEAISQILYEVVKALHASPELSLIRIMASLHGTENYKIMYGILNAEQLLDENSDFVAELNGAINNMIRLNKRIKRKIKK